MQGRGLENGLEECVSVPLREGSFKAEGFRGWVMQCPASRGAGAPVVCRELVPQVPNLPAMY